MQLGFDNLKIMGITWLFQGHVEDEPHPSDLRRLNARVSALELTVANPLRTSIEQCRAKIDHLTQTFLKYPSPSSVHAMRDETAAQSAAIDHLMLRLNKQMIEIDTLKMSIKK